MPEAWDVKLDRADEHLGELARSIQELHDSGDFAAVTDQIGTERAVRLVLKAEIPSRFSAIVGVHYPALGDAARCRWWPAFGDTSSVPSEQKAESGRSSGWPALRRGSSRV